jgi:hypothetical protein
MHQRTKVNPTAQLNRGMFRRSNPSADRTRSADARAGSRRNKQLRSVGPRAKDYPATTIHYYNCDGSYAGSATIRHTPRLLAAIG